MSYHDIHPAKLQALCAEPELLILDSRDPDSYARGCLDGAQPVSDALLRQLMKSRQRARPVLVYCHHGNASRDLCHLHRLHRQAGRAQATGGSRRQAGQGNQRRLHRAGERFHPGGAEIPARGGGGRVRQPRPTGCQGPNPGTTRSWPHGDCPST
jgi:rhodanese-related sulfurtransferase